VTDEDQRPFDASSPNQRVDVRDVALERPATAPADVAPSDARAIESTEAEGSRCLAHARPGLGRDRESAVGERDGARPAATDPQAYARSDLDRLREVRLYVVGRFG
jgi:hypothetical protein